MELKLDGKLAFKGKFIRNLESEYRVIKMLHVIKIFIDATNRLEAKDIKCLEQIASLMNESGKFKSQEPREMTISDIETALGYPVKIIKERGNEKM